MKTLGLGAVSLAAADLAQANQDPDCSPATFHNKPAKDSPNIIFIFTDQHRLSAIGAYGKTVCRTPHLDKLAAKGVRFENAYTSCPLCSPARATVMTGQHIHTHRVGANIGEFDCNISQLPDNPDLLSRKLGAAGYQCGYSGKWHLGTRGRGNNYALPSTRGFVGQDFPGHGGGGFGYPEYREWLKQRNFTHRVIPHKTDGIKIRNYGVLEGPAESTVPHFLTDHTISMIDQFQAQGQPFFIWHNTWGPHEPYYVPEKYYNMYKDVEIPPWPNYDWRPENPYNPDQLKRHPNVDALTWEDWAESIRHYYAFTTLIDDQIGRLMDHLEKKGLTDNTIIIFSSDHGETQGSHGGLTDKGWNHYEEIQRIGLIVMDPRQKQANKRGVVINEFASLVDIYPTILSYASAPYDTGRIHGRSLVDLAEGKKVKWRDSVFVEFFGLSHMSTNMITCRHGQIKYGYTCSNKDELYDLAKDPYEMTNLIDDPKYGEIAQNMRRRIYTFMDKTNYPGKGNFLRSRFGYSSERQYRYSPDPVNPKDFIIEMEF